MVYGEKVVYFRLTISLFQKFANMLEKLKFMILCSLKTCRSMAGGLEK